jgi:hypothetical protein
MTRVAYAQLSGQRWTPPRVFGALPTGHLHGAEREKEQRRWEMAAKVAAGAEMLYQETKSRHAAFSSASSSAAAAAAGVGQSVGEARLDALRRDTGWRPYVQRLGRAGWFAGEVEGSARWKEREQQAADAYIAARASEYVLLQASKLFSLFVS